ncbi:MAG: hypothetical protein ACO3JL_18480, partial [Myxococcota bacterium]
MGTETTRLRRRHRAVYTERTRLVARGGHHPAWSDSTDDDGLTAKLRTVTLLDRTLPLDLSVAQEFDVPGRLRVIGAKSFADGTLGSRTAAMLEPYAGTTSPGSLIEHAHDGTLVEWMRAVAAAGLSPSIH